MTRCIAITQWETRCGRSSVPFTTCSVPLCHGHLRPLQEAILRQEEEEQDAFQEWVNNRPTRQSDRSGSIIYYVERLDNGLIKIGTTVNIEKRMMDLRRDVHRVNCETDLVLLAQHAGSFQTEKAIHRLFPDERIGRSEWFRPSARLQSHIKDVVAKRTERAVA